MTKSIKNLLLSLITHFLAVEDIFPHYRPPISFLEHLSAYLHVPNVSVGYIRMCRVFVCIGTGAHACDRHFPNGKTQTCQGNRDKMAVVADSLSLVTIPDSLPTLLVEIYKYEFGDTNSLYKAKQYPVINEKISRSGSECISGWRSRRIYASTSSARRRLAPWVNSRSRRDVTRSNPPYCSRVFSQLFPLYHV